MVRQRGTCKIGRQAPELEVLEVVDIFLNIIFQSTDLEEEIKGEEHPLSLGGSRR